MIRFEIDQDPDTSSLYLLLFDLCASVPSVLNSGRAGVKGPILPESRIASRGRPEGITDAKVLEGRER